MLSTDIDDTEPGVLERRSHRERRRFHFDPTINMGSVLTILTIFVTMGAGLMSYSADQARKEATALQLRQDVNQNRAEVKETLTRIESSSEELRKGMYQMQMDIAIMKAQQKNGLGK